MKQWYMYDEYDVVHPNFVKYSQKCRILKHNMSDPEGGVHLTKMSL